jgi:integrase
MGYEPGYEMSRRAAADRQYLELHRERWRVSVAVPKHLHGVLGTRLKRPLNTDSLTIANQLKWPIVREFQHLIANGGAPGEQSPSILAEEFRRQRKQVDDTAELDDHIQITAETLRGPEVGTSPDPDTGEEHPVYDERREREAGSFVRQALGLMVPVDHLHDRYLAQLTVKARTKADDERAMKMLKRWCAEEGIEPSLQSFPDKKAAVRFLDALPTLAPGLDPVTLNKYPRRLASYWKWLEARDEVAVNVWQGLTLPEPDKPHDELERPFTREEMAALLTGDAASEMHDLMRIGALTGCRLDPIVSLKVKDCREDGVFVFKPQKREKAARLCPIHSDLREIVARRTDGKKPNDPVFPEWPEVPPELSAERSNDASQEFTAYRRRVGVDDVVAGRRRSRVNFHSFRRWFITEAERANQQPHLIAVAVGHKREGMTLGVYSAGPLIEQVREVVEAVKLPAA